MFCAQVAASSSNGGGSSAAQQEQLQQQVASLNKRIASLQHDNQHLQSEVSRLTAFTAAMQSSAAAAATSADKPVAHTGGSSSGGATLAGAASTSASHGPTGLTPIRPHRLAGSTLKSGGGSVGMPGTPTDHTTTQAPQGTEVGCGGVGGSSSTDRRGLRAGGRRGFSSDDGGQGVGVSAGDKAGQAGGGVTYASQQWEEVKTLQGKVDALG